MATPLKQQIAISQSGPDEYASASLPMGNGGRTIAYGGGTTSVAVHAASKTVSAKHKLYSVLGHFLGPTSLDQPLRCKVTRTRDTKSFATRRVEVFQAQKDGRGRRCLELIADFHAEESPLLRYSAPPSRRYSGPDGSSSRAELLGRMVREGRTDTESIGPIVTMFETWERNFDIRFCPEGMSGQNLGATARHIATDQDGLPSTSKTSAEWYKVRESQPMTDEAENWAALAYLMDGGLAFLPLVHEHLGVDEVGAWSSLDFALRIFQPKLDMNSWNLRERVSHAADVGRAYSESRFWDERGTLVASMTQQSILRPKSKPKATL